MPFIRLHDATRIHYREHGAGTPLLLLHANPGDSRDFDAVFPALVTRHRVIAVDWPGYGQSSLPEYPERITVCDFHRTLLAIINTLALPPALIIGNSVGGNVAARLAAEHPDKVLGLVLVAPGGFTPHGRLTRSFCALQGSRFALSPRRFAGLYLKRRNAVTNAMLERAAGEQSTPDRLALNRTLWRSFGRPESDLRGVARQIRAPTMLLFGQHDIAIPAHRDGVVARACIPHAGFATLPCGHAAFAESPDLFLDAVQPFLADCVERDTRVTESR